MSDILAQVLLQAGFGGLLLFVLWRGSKILEPFLSAGLAELKANTAALIALAGKVDATGNANKTAIETGTSQVLAKLDAVQDATTAKVEAVHAAVLAEVYGLKQEADTARRDRTPTGSHRAVTGDPPEEGQDDERRPRPAQRPASPRRG